MSSGFSKLKTSQDVDEAGLFVRLSGKGLSSFSIFSLFFSRLIDQALFHATD